MKIKQILFTGLLVLPMFVTTYAAPMNLGMSFDNNLWVGSRGDNVVQLQTYLMENGYLNIPAATGFFGAATKMAVMKYQMDNSISATGYFGMLTRNNINNKMTMKMDNETGVMVGGASMLPSRDIVDNAVLANNVTTVVAAVKAAGLVDTLKGKGPFTVFAPTNSAFEKLPTGTVETLLKAENKAKLTDILTYHVVAGRYTSKDLRDGMMLTTVEGKQLKINVKDGKVWINGSAMVETADVISSNGVTHVIDSVLLPQ